MGAFVDADRLDPEARMSLQDRLDHAAKAVEQGLEVPAIRFLEQFITRANTQIKGDASHLAVRDALIREAELWLRQLEAV